MGSVGEPEHHPQGIISGCLIPVRHPPPSLYPSALPPPDGAVGVPHAPRSCDQGAPLKLSTADVIVVALKVALRAVPLPPSTLNLCHEVEIDTCWNRFRFIWKAM